MPIHDPIDEASRIVKRYYHDGERKPVVWSLPTTYILLLMANPMLFGPFQLEEVKAFDAVVKNYVNEGRKLR